MSIFKMCDIRGVYGQDLTDEVGYHLGRAVATQLPGATVAVGGDLRPSTPALTEALVAGLRAGGVDVLDLGTLPTPAFYYGKRWLGAQGGVMVTASHNPPRYNGFKLILGDLPVVPEDLQALAQLMAGRQYREGNGGYRREAVLERYTVSLVEAFGGLQPHHVVVDAGNGSLWAAAPAVLRQVGQQVEELFCTPDGRFPNRDPNPAVPEHLVALCERVLSSRAALGLAYDGDGDRVVFVDGLGRVLPADRLLVLLLRHALAGVPGGAVVYDLKCSSVVADEILAAGGRPVMERSGHAFIKRRLMTEGAVLGGEISGHYFFGELGGDDALYASLYLLRVLDALGQSLAQAIDAVPAYPITPDLRLPCPAEEAQQILSELLAAFADQPIDRLDGVRVRFSTGWALARISVTEPLITLRFEARTSAELEAIQARVRTASPRLQAIMARAGL